MGIVRKTRIEGLHWDDAARRATFAPRDGVADRAFAALEVGAWRAARRATAWATADATVAASERYVDLKRALSGPEGAGR